MTATNLGADGDSLQTRVHHLLERGVLPLRSPDRLWGGPGSGAACAVCSAGVEQGQTEIEVEFDEAGVQKRLWLHSACFLIWDRVRRSLRKRQERLA